jgi:hypothetical protein
MLQQLPRRVRRQIVADLELAPAQFCRKISHGLIKRRVRLTAIEQRNQVLSQCCVIDLGRSAFRGRL